MADTAERTAMGFITAGWITPAQAADILGVHRFTIHRKMRALGIDAEAGKAAWLRKMARRIHGTGWRAPTKSDLRAKAQRAVSTFVSDR